MPTTQGTDPAAVRVEIDTHLEDGDISDVLDRIEREINRAYESGLNRFEDSQHRQDFEAALTALRIAEGRDRRAEEATSGRSATTYEAAEIAQLRKRVRRADPGETFGHAGRVRRDTGRHVTSGE